MNGVTIVDGGVTYKDNNSGGPFNYDPNLALNPPLGYTSDPTSTKMVISGRSWSRQAAP